MGFDTLLQPQNRVTGQKLGIATAAMFVLPFVVFYGVWYWLEQVGSNQGQPRVIHVFGSRSELLVLDSLQAAGLAACFMVNLIIAGYVYVAFQESDEDLMDETDARRNTRQKSDKDSTNVPPRVGIYKERTD